MKENWMLMWNSWVAPTKVPGIWLRKDGGFLVRVRAIDPSTGKRKELKATLTEGELSQAVARQEELLGQIRSGVAATEVLKQRFSDYAVSLLERKIAQREIRSAVGRKNWVSVLEFLISGTHEDGEVPVRGLGELFVDQIKPQHLDGWRSDIGKRITAGELSPHTANSRMSILKVVLKQAKRDFSLPSFAAEDLKRFDTSEHDTFTEEEPNSLTLDEVPRFLARLKELYSQHFAMTYVGLALGLRPSSLRPLRRKGLQADVLWEDNVLLVRRSQTVGDEVMETTKTKRKQRMHVPVELMDVLRWHVETQLETPEMQESDLLFPSIDGGYRAPTVLNKPFGAVALEIELGKHFTQKGMRRTFQDLARGAGLREEVQKRICGHITDEMKERYSTVGQGEQREAIAKVLDLMDFRKRAPEGAHPGVHGPEMGVQNEKTG